MPFVIAIGRNQAAPPPDRIFESGFLPHGLHADIDQERKFTGVFHPGRPQSPAHQAKMPAAFVHHHWYRLRRRNIISRREIWLFQIAEKLPYRFRRRGYNKASAHYWYPNKYSSVTFYPQP